MRDPLLALVLVGSIACSNGGEDDTGGTVTFTTTAPAESGSSGTTTNLTTSISASSTVGNDGSTSTDATASGSSSAATTGGSSSEGGFDCPNPMPAGEYTDCDMGCPGGNCLNIDGGAMGADYRICNRGCLSVCNCRPPPEMTADTGSSGGGAGEYSAELVCIDLETATMDGCDVPGVCSCVLECMGKTCPAGTVCIELAGGVSVCAFEVAP